MTSNVVVVIGLGGMGELIARRQGPGRKLVIADFNDQALQSVSSRLEGDGYDVSAQHVDVGSADSVDALVQIAASAGPVTEVVHTAGLSPTQASVADILRVDLYGAALVLERFGNVIAPQGAGVAIASMAGHMMGDLPSDQQKDLATAPLEELLALPVVQSVTDTGFAYTLAKYANRLRVRSESLKWGKRGGRLNSVSPGIIATPMGRQELDGPSGTFMRAMVDASGTGRLGTPADIADAVAYLLSSQSSFITGTDLLVDGGVVAAVTSGAITVGPDAV
jgi:NAD(P)-dependent dehydrogenase (short-subunit alcohol dehydrogenase family)